MSCYCMINYWFWIGIGAKFRNPLFNIFKFRIKFFLLLGRIKYSEIAGGSLVNEDGSLRSTVAQFGLKKDFNNVKHYANPIKITRVNVTFSNKDGYGKTAIKGKVYQIWIAKDDPAKGMPAPIRVLVPEGHDSITTPKVTNVGSY